MIDGMPFEISDRAAWVDGYEKGVADGLADAAFAAQARVDDGGPRRAEEIREWGLLTDDHEVCDGQLTAARSQADALAEALGELYRSLPRYSCKADAPDGCAVCVARSALASYRKTASGEMLECWRGPPATRRMRP